MDDNYFSAQEAAFPLSMVGQLSHCLWFPCCRDIEENLLQVYIHEVCMRQTAGLINYWTWSMLVPLESTYEENTSQLAMGRNKILCGLW